MAEQLLETKSMEEAIFEIVSKSLPPAEAKALTNQITGGLGGYIASLTHKDFIAFARTMLQQGFAYAVEAKYPLGIQQAMARAHDQLLEEEKRQ